MAPKKSFEQVKKEIEEYGYRLNMTEETFTNCRYVDVFCKCGSEWTTELFVLKKGRGCKNCSAQRRAKTRRMGNGRYNNIKKFLNDIKYTLISDKKQFVDTDDSKTDVEFKCENNHLNKLNLYSFLNKRDAYQKGKIPMFCNSCKLNETFGDNYVDRKTQIEEILGQYNHQLIELENDLKNFTFTCGNCGENSKSSLRNINKDDYTGYCIRCFNHQNRKPYDDVVKEVENYGLKLLTKKENYKDNKQLEIGCDGCDLYYPKKSLSDLKRRVFKHYHCQKCFIGIQGSDTRFEPFCFRCYCIEHPNEDIPRMFKMKETCFRDSILKFLEDEKLSIDYETPTCDKKIVDGCSKKRPDIFIDCYTHCIILELDENQHTRYTCENKRICALWEDVAYRPIVILRMNPDSYIDECGEYHKTCFRYDDKGRMYVHDEFNERVDRVCQELIYHMIRVPDKSMTIKHFYYSENNNELINLTKYYKNGQITISKKDFTQLKCEETVVDSIMNVLKTFQEPILPVITEKKLSVSYDSIVRDSTEILIDKVIVNQNGKIFLNKFINPLLIDTCKKGKKSFRQVWNDLELREKLVERSVKYDETFSNGSLFGCYGCTYGRLYNFPPNVAKALYNHFQAKNVLDFCSGYAGRLLGFYTSNAKKYVGIDPNNKIPYSSIVDKLKCLDEREKDIMFVNDCAENVDYTKLGTFDFIFTSPPYFDIEIYSDDKTQSCHKFPIFEEWLEKFLFTVLRKVIQVLESGGHLCINIKDTEKYSIVEPMLKFLRGFGLVEKTHIKLMTAKRFVNNTKYEYIYVFEKK